jgi:hypothetical protein
LEVTSFTAKSGQVFQNVSLLVTSTRFVNGKNISVTEVQKAICADDLKLSAGMNQLEVSINAKQSFLNLFITGAKPVTSKRKAG